MARGWLLYAALMCAVLPGACGRKKQSPQVPAGVAALPRASVSSPSAVPRPSSISFASVAAQSGIRFTLGHQGRSPLTILETAGGGCAFLDYDGDGWPDILLVGPHNVALYHNLRNGKFADVTATSGLTPDRYWMGCAVGDYDGDGRPDIFLTGYRCAALYHNLGGGHFEDVTAHSGISGLDWSLSAAFADLTGSGRLDLFVSQYLHYDGTTPQICQVGSVRSSCGPEVYTPLSGMLFRNEDGHRFRALPWHDTGKTWGVVASDLLGEGRPALYLANDLMPGDLWRRKPSGGWQNIGASSGTAYDAQGHVQGGMGVDAGDYDNDGLLDLIVTTYFAQSLSLYHNDGNGLFTVTSSTTGVGSPSMPFVKFGVAFADLDNDGWLDLIVTSGHVRDNAHQFDTSQTYAQPVQVFHNNRGHFADVTAQAGDASGLRMVGRGLAVADYNLDGRADVLICNLEGEAVLLENTSPGGRWLNVQLRDRGTNRFGIGAVLRLQTAGLTQTREIRTSGSVLSAQYPTAHFGLGPQEAPTVLRIRWPDGQEQQVQIKQVDTTLTVSHADGLPGRMSAH